VKDARRHAQGRTAIHLPLKLIKLYWISEIILDGLELLETSKSITRTKWRSIGLIGFHGSIQITSLCIMEKSPMFCHPINHLTTQLTLKHERSPYGDLSTLSQKKSYQCSRNTSRKCSTRERSAQVSHQQVYISTLFLSRGFLIPIINSTFIELSTAAYLFSLSFLVLS